MVLVGDQGHEAVDAGKLEPVGQEHRRVVEAAFPRDHGSLATGGSPTSDIGGSFTYRRLKAGRGSLKKETAGNEAVYRPVSLSVLSTQPRPQAEPSFLRRKRDPQAGVLPWLTPPHSSRPHR